MGNEGRRGPDLFRARLLRIAIVGALLAVAVFGARLLWSEWPTSDACSRTELDEASAGAATPLLITFGTSRTTRVRTQTVAVDGEDSVEDLGGASGATLSVRLVSDLQQIGEPRAELPSSQVTVGSTRIASDRVTVSAAVDPGQPEEVPGGCYSGTVLISAGGETSALPIVVDIASREGIRAIGAFLVLLFGASLGLTIKWITESLTPLAAQRRRLDRLKATLRISDASVQILPVGAQVLLEDAEDRIDRNDIAGIDANLQPLEEHRAELIATAATISRFRERMEAHEELAAFRWGGMSAGSRRLLIRVAGVERERIEEIRRVPWPDGGAELGAKIDLYRNDLQVIEDAVELLRAKGSGAQIRAVFLPMLNGDFDEARERLRDPLPPALVEGDEADDRNKSEVEVEAESERRIEHAPMKPGYAMSVVVQNARPIAAVASILIVALIGLQLEYLDPAAFDDSLGDWLTLFLWALAVELSGVSVLEVVGRLANASSGQSRAP